MTTNKFHGSMSGCLVLSIHASIFYKSPWSMATMAVQTCDNLWQLSKLLTLGGDNCSGFLLSFFDQRTVRKRRAVVVAFWVSICLVKFWPYSRPRNSFLVLNNLLLLQWTDERKLDTFLWHLVPGNFLSASRSWPRVQGQWEHCIEKMRNIADKSLFTVGLRC